MRKPSRFALPLTVLAIVFFVILADQTTKSMMRQFFERHGTSNSWPLGTVIHQNHGIVANVPIPLYIILLLTIAALILISWMSYHAMHKGNIRALIALSLIFGGALSNALDRAVFGYVFDWILVFQSGALNIADVMIGGGIVGYVLFGSAKPPTPNP
ncbi:MAG: signal peptidase II [Patescibacteria group bacterium]